MVFFWSEFCRWEPNSDRNSFGIPSEKQLNSSFEFVQIAVCQLRHILMTISNSSRIPTKIHSEFHPKSSWTHLKTVCCSHYSFGFLQIAVCQLRHVLITIFGFVSQKIAMSSNVPKNFYCQELTYPWWSEIWWVSVLYESSNLIWDSL